MTLNLGVICRGMSLLHLNFVKLAFHVQEVVLQLLLLSLRVLELFSKLLLVVVKHLYVLSETLQFVGVDLIGLLPLSCG